MRTVWIFEATSETLHPDLSYGKYYYELQNQPSNHNKLKTFFYISFMPVKVTESLQFTFIKLLNKVFLVFNIFINCMCGICLILNIPIDQHHFNFNFFQFYNPSPESEVLPLNKHIQQYKLMLPDPPEISRVARLLGRRGPDQLVAHHIDMYKTNYRVIEKEGNVSIDKGNAIGVQSILHMRGQHSYTPECPGSYFLFNGEIWETGNLPPIDEEGGENDSKWLHRTLMACRGSEEKILEVLGQIRGDYAIVLIEGDQIFIMKDYFGKRSLLLGMSENHLILSSSPFEQFLVKEEVAAGQNAAIAEEDHEQSWKTKYQAEWLSSKGKQLFEIPSNSLISIHLRNGEAFWTHQTIHQIDLKKIGLEKRKDSVDDIIITIKKLLVQSVREIIRCVKGVFHNGSKEMGCKIAVMFSGGIDSTLIARLLDLTLPKEEEIDLVNLAFRQDAPDRQAARISYEQLRSLNPSRRYNLILLNKNLDDIEKIKKNLMQSIYPKSTHMDFNIAAALHLASAGTSAKIVMSGLGADQIFAGYSRYRIAFKRAGYEQMENEMIFDMERLWIRNLGRDDRAIGMNGKEARFPFLYLPLWTYLRTVPLPTLTEGNGEKMLLRCVAREFGLNKPSYFKKKAIQFGTRLAKLSNVKSFGSNRKAKGTYQYR